MSNYTKEDLAKAYLTLAKCYQGGILVGQNHFQALLYYEKAAQYGDTDAALYLGDYFKKLGNKERTCYWYQKAVTKTKNMKLQNLKEAIAALFL